MKTIPLFNCLLLLFSLSLGIGRDHPVKILMAGDSTMADKPLFKTVKESVTGEETEEPFLERGWGQLLPELISEKGEVLNFARNGRSTRTFVEEGLWSELYSQIAPGDLVIIQFGHNDGVTTKASYTNPVQFRLNLVAFVNEVKAKGGYPILCTPVARRKFDEKGVLMPTHGEYPDIVRSVAAQEKVTLIDMEILTSHWLQEVGVEKSRRFFHKIPPGVSRLYPDGLDDNTHFNEEGAREVARLFAEACRKEQVDAVIRLLKTQ